MVVLKHELRMNLKSLIIWTSSLGAMILIFILMFPSLENTLGDMAGAYSNMGSFTEAFGLDKLSIGNIMGFYGTEIGIMFALGGALFSSLLGGGILSKEEGGHTSEFLFTLPCTRKRIVIEKLISVIVLIGVFNIICIAIALLSFGIIGEEIKYSEFFLFHLAQFIMHVEVAVVCFAISAFQKKTSYGLGIGIALILYFMDMLTRIFKDLELLKYITPFYYSSAADIISSNSLDEGLVALGIVVIIIMTIIGVIKYSTKDLAA